nr:NUDIX domain-containing protein [uncultured Lachnoclostridium sp.]
MEKYKILVKGIVQHDDKYLLVKRWYDDRIEDPYQWEFLDGQVIFGESPDKAVVRIVADKTGIDAYIGKIMYTWSFMMGDVCNIGLSYLLETAHEEVVLSEDLIEYKWVTKDEIKQYITNPSVLKDIEKSLTGEL